MNYKDNEWIFTDFNGQMRIDRQKLYSHLKENLKMLITDKDNYYLFEDGIYKQISQREIKALIKKNLPVQCRTSKDWESVWKEFSTDFPDVKETDFNANENLVPFQNGVLDLSTGELKAFDEKLLLTRKIHCNYVVGKKY